MTLSRFLRNYLYVPLGGNRRGPARRSLNLMLTMLLGGLWHGAGWNFVLWGGLHGVGLTVNHGWRALRRGAPTRRLPLVRAAARLATFLFVLLGWVFFRAETPQAALGILTAMVGLADGAATAALTTATWGALGALLAGVWLLPNSQQWVGLDGDSPAPRLAWRPTAGWAFGLGLAALFAVIGLFENTEFIYFRF